MERTFIMVKPNGVARGLTGEVVARFERRGFALRGLKLLRIDRALAERHYAEHAGKPFFESLVSFITSGPVVAMILEADNAIARWRDLMGPTNSSEAPSGTLRGDFGTDIEKNAVHGSDAPETAAKEMAYFFNATEVQAVVEAL